VVGWKAHFSSDCKKEDECACECADVRKRGEEIKDKGASVEYEKVTSKRGYKRQKMN
jgi:hypothetical protein